MGSHEKHSVPLVADLRDPVASVDPAPRPWSSWRSVTAIAQGPAETLAFVEATLPRRPARVLEVGCGTGWLALELARTGHDVVAIDPSEKGLAVAAATVARQPPDGRLVHRLESLEAFDAPPATFDAVVFNLSLHHLDDLPGGLRKARRLLGASGRIVVQDFAYDRMDLRTMGWMKETEELIAAACGSAPAEPSPAEDRLRDWREHYEEHRLHRFPALLGGLRATFRELSFQTVPYLHVRIAATRPPPPPGAPEPLVAHLRAEEARKIATGAIAPVAYRFVGEPAG